MKMPSGAPRLALSRRGWVRSSPGLVPQVRVHRLDANLGLGLPWTEEHAGLAARHFELAISYRPPRGLKPARDGNREASSARLKSCPDTKLKSHGSLKKKNGTLVASRLTTSH